MGNSEYKRELIIKLMKTGLRFCKQIGILGLFACCFLGFGVYPQEALVQSPTWPGRYEASFGIEIMADHNNSIIVAVTDTTSQAYKLGVRPGMEVIGWNTLPIRKKLESMKVRKYRKTFPLMTDEKIKLILLARGRPGETAEVFFLTPTGNNWGVRLTTDR